jgi:hypothetical protein
LVGWSGTSAATMKSDSAESMDEPAKFTAIV